MSSESINRRRSAFTLIELLVVVAIISLLISILLPSLKRARDQAKQIVCGTRLRELYHAATEYATDNRGYYPRGIQGFGDGSPDNNDEYNVFSSALLPYLGYDGKERLWASSRSPNLPGGAWKDIIKHLNKVMLDFDVFHCNAFPVDFYDDPSDRRFFYGNAAGENEFGPGGVNPMHFIASAFAMPYGQPSLKSADPNPCWVQDAAMQPVTGHPGNYAESSTLESFPLDCQPATKIYVTGVDKSVPWVQDNASGGQLVGQRFNTMFLAGHLSFGDRPRMGEDERHPGGLNNLFFDGHVKALNNHKMDPGCQFELDQRLNLFTVMSDDWKAGDTPP